MGIVSANLVSHHVHPFRTFYNEFAIIFALLLSLVFAFSRGTYVIQPRVVWGLFALLLMMAFQLVTQMVWPHQVIFPAMYIVLAILAVFFGAHLSREEFTATNLCDAIAKAHVLVALLSVGMECVQIMGWDWRPLVMYMPTQGVANVRPFANIAQPNQLALMLCFGLAGIWWLRQQTKLKGMPAFLMCVVLVWGLALTQSRIAWLILPIFAGLSVSALIGKKREPFSPILILLFLYVLLVFFLKEISQWIGFSSGSVIERIGGRSERSILAQQALSMIGSHPWLGVGWFGFGPAQVDIGAEFSPTIYAEHSHNLVLNIAAELGLPFAILFFGAMLIWVWRTCMNLSMRRRPETGLFLLFLIAAGIHSLVEFPLWYAFVLVPLMVLAGVVHGLRWKQEASSIPATVIQRLAILGLLFSAFVVYDFQRVVEGFAEFRRAKDYASMNVEKVQRPSFTLMSDYYSYFSVMRILPAKNMTRDQIEFLEESSRRFGYVHVLSKLAEVYVLNGEEQKAIKTMRTLSKLHPYYYPEYYDYWQSLSARDQAYARVFATMPARDFAEQ